MKLVELTDMKGGALWLNAGQLLYVCPAAGAGGSLYGDSQAVASTRVHFVNGASIEVRQPLAEVVARLGAGD